MDLISRQAAIDYLVTNMNWYDEDGYETNEDEKIEAITDLINGVPSAQPEKRTEERTETRACDLIDRQAAIYALREEFKKLPTTAIRAMSAIKILPSAEPDDEAANYWHEKANSYEQTLVKLAQSRAEQPERKKGRWIFYESENDRYDDMKCPFCKKSYTVDAYRIDDIGFTAGDLKFCPNCGADMRG